MPLNALQLCSQRGFKHSVFISYPHRISERGAEIVHKIAKALEDSYQDFPGADQAGVYIDTRLRSGYTWNPALRRNLCRSVVTLVILVPNYFASDYCSLEWGITEQLKPGRIPTGSDETPFILIRLVPEGELSPPSQVAAIQFEKEFDDLMVWGWAVETHPNWLALIRELRTLVFDRIKVICAANREAAQWDAEEKLALELEKFEFKWTDEDLAADTAFPALTAVEKKP